MHAQTLARGCCAALLRAALIARCMLRQLCNEKLQDALADGAAAAPVAARPLKLKQVAPHAMADLYVVCCISRAVPAQMWTRCMLHLAWGSLHRPPRGVWRLKLRGTPCLSAVVSAVRNGAEEPESPCPCESTPSPGADAAGVSPVPAQM